uniref:Cystatin domain-containing protein n=1 Tax=Ditylenchus dipsaci TaxID=166011 RepID=A0A915EHU1_9BILA
MQKCLIFLLGLCLVVNVADSKAIYEDVELDSPGIEKIANKVVEDLNDSCDSGQFSLLEIVSAKEQKARGGVNNKLELMLKRSDCSPQQYSVQVFESFDETLGELHIQGI